MKRAIVAAAVIIWLVILAIGMMAAAHAHDHEHPELNQWFMDLKSGKGLCCDGDEALHLTDVQWETAGEAGHQHYRVKIPVDAAAYERARHGEEVDTMWADVPDDAVVDEPNKVGQAMVWPIYGYLGASVRCFMPGAEG